MSDQIEDIVIPILRKLQEDVSGLKEDVGILKEAARRTDARMSSIDHHLAGFHSKLNWRDDELDAYRGRIEKLEDLTSPDKPS